MSALNQNKTKPESLPFRQTAPVWFQDYFLSTGHDETTRNATVTFVKRRGCHYAVTCRHVLEAVTEPETVPGARLPTMALEVDQVVLNFSSITMEGIKSTFWAPKPERQSTRPDIALAKIDDSRWELLSSRKNNKVGIDLDSWREPNWSDVQSCLASGYADEHKEKTTLEDGSEKLATWFLKVVTELDTTLELNEPKFSLYSHLDDPPVYGFSGMSGGPLYAIEESKIKGDPRFPIGEDDPRFLIGEDEALFPIGIVFEGSPSTIKSAEQSHESTTQGFLDKRDILLGVLTLTPETFDEWLKACAELQMDRVLD